MKTLLEIASDVSEEITIYTDNSDYSQTTEIINEFGDIVFECEIEVQHKYYPGDAETGDSYSFDVTKVDVTILEASDGILIKILAKLFCLVLESLNTSGLLLFL